MMCLSTSLLFFLDVLFVGISLVIITMIIQEKNTVSTNWDRHPTNRKERWSRQKKEEDHQLQVLPTVKWNITSAANWWKFKYLDMIFTPDGKHTTDVRRRIGMIQTSHEKYDTFGSRYTCTPDWKYGCTSVQSAQSWCTGLRRDTSPLK